MTLTSVVVAGLLAVTSPTEMNDELFAVLDANHDGVIVSSEVAESQRVWFTRALRVADDNGDARLTSKELSQALTDPKPRKAPAQRRRGQRQRLDPKRLDRNKDGMITLDEVRGPGKKRFQRLLDRTGKKAIAVEGFFRMIERGQDSKSMRESRNDSRARESEMKDTRRQTDKSTDNKRRGDKRRPGASELFRRFDKNQDNRITRDEAPDRLISRFDRIDANGDGELTRQELARLSKRRKQKSKSK
ncbi:MAG: hypothetical protein MK102_14730 [Fuerstiella sp.]|nr:hypothetical protein [Fuerstiella sp.]